MVEEETLVGAGLRAKRDQGEEPKTGGMGEIAVDEYATRLAREGSAATVPLVLFEDPDVLELRIARLANVHLMNTAALIGNLHALGVLEEGPDLLRQSNSRRASPMRRFDRPAKTARIRSTLKRAVTSPWER